jgi:hypothetical protein
MPLIQENVSSDFHRACRERSAEISVAGGFADVQGVSRRCDDAAVSCSRVPRPIIQVKTSLILR